MSEESFTEYPEQILYPGLSKGTSDNYRTIALDSGAGIKAVADRLGHKDIRTTLAVYTHVSPSMRVKTADLIEKEFSDKPLELVVHTA